MLNKALSTLIVKSDELIKFQEVILFEESLSLKQIIIRNVEIP